MKVLLVVEAALGGSGRHVLDLAEGLVAGGKEVHLVYSNLRADFAFTARLASLCDTKPQFRSHSIPIARELGFSDLRAYIELSRYVRRYGPFDIIHGHSTKAGFLARLLLRRRGTRSVYTPHGLMTLDPQLRGPRRWAVCALETRLAGLCDAVVAVSANEHQCAIETGIAVDKLVVVPNGVHPQEDGSSIARRHQVRRALGLCPDTICIGWVGRLVEPKAPARIIESFVRLSRRTARPLSLAVIGWGPLENMLRSQASALRVAKNVMFLGQVDGVAHMPAFDILAHTSRFEGFGYVFLEALSAGVPIVTTHVGGADELVSDGVTGYICDPWDAEAFAAYLQRLVENPQLRSTMALAARERAAQFGFARMVESIQELYHRVCDLPSSAQVDRGAERNAFEQSS